MIYNLDKINEMADGDEDFINSVISVFLEEVPQDLVALENALNEKNHEQAYQLAHKIKPNVDLLGMEQTRATALEIETMGKENSDISRMAELFQVLKKDIHQVVGELRNDFNV